MLDGNNMNEQHISNLDRAVKLTADDAILAKLSCVEKKYYEDPYIHSMSLGASGLVNKNRGNGNNSNNRAQHSRYQGGSRNASTNVNSTEPIIRKGTHARVKSIEKAIDAFLSLPLSCSSTNGNNNDASSSSSSTNNNDKVDRQIVILGSGRDTTYLRYRFQNNNNSNNGNIVNWYEVDHPSIIIQKAHSWLPNCIPKEYDYNCNVNNEYENSYSVTIALKENDDSSNNYQMKNHQKCTSNYHLIGHDLRSSPSVLFDKLIHPNHAYNKSIPTLFIFECVIMYLPDVASRELLHYIAQSPTYHSSSTNHCDSTTLQEDVPFVAVVIYDPIPSNDRFGQLMVDNLQRVGIGSNNRASTQQQRQRRNNSNDDNDNDDDSQSQQLSLVKTRTLQDQLTKLTQCGFDMATGCDMMDAYNYGIISTNERQRVAEILDELEEFVLLMKHYCLVVGVCSLKERDNSDTTTISTANRRCVGYELCSVGEGSVMGFQNGRCMVAAGTTQQTKNAKNNRQNFS